MARREKIRFSLHPRNLGRPRHERPLAGVNIIRHGRLEVRAARNRVNTAKAIINPPANNRTR
jgi:hypothetical protein